MLIGMDTKRRTTKQQNYKTQNSEKQNDDHYKSANTTKERIFETYGELTSEYTVFQIMIGKQQISIGTSRKTANWR